MTTERETAAFSAFYKETTGRLSRKMKKINDRLAKEDNPILRKFMLDTADLNTGGKMLRGAFVCLGYEIASGRKDELADDLALAFEVFQTGILIHDDVIDRAEKRRGKETIHTRYSKSLDERQTYAEDIDFLHDTHHVADASAICAGDYALYTANQIIAENYSGNPALGQILTYFNYIVLQTIRGELLDVVLPYELEDGRILREEKNRLLTRSVYDIYHLKTSIYSVLGPLHLGMLLGGASDADMRKMDECADELGVAFQIKDDILGMFADAREVGKDVGSDMKEFKQTILYQYVAVKKPEDLSSLLTVYGKSDAGLEELKYAQEIFRSTGALEYAEHEMKRCFERACGVLSEMEFITGEYRDVMRGLIEYLGSRRK